MRDELPEHGRVDMVIIGGGPSGLFGAFYAGLRNMSVTIIDSLPELGGQLTALYPEKRIYDMPGHPEILAAELARLLAEQAMQANPRVCLEEQALALDHVTPEWIAVTTDRGVHITRTVLIAGGIGAFAPRRLRVPGVEELTGRGVHYFVKDKQQFRGQRVLIVGGGDSACDWAADLTGIAKEIMLIHRRDVFRAHEENVQRLTRLPVTRKLFRELKEVHGTARVEAATIQDNRTKETEQIAVDAVLLTLGFQASLGPITGWGLRLQGNAIRVDSTMATSLPGVYAAGDIATYPGKVTLIATGIGEAATAVNHARRYIDPAAALTPDHSSDKDDSVKSVKVPT